MGTNVIQYTVLQNYYNYFSLPIDLYYKCITFRKNSTHTETKTMKTATHTPGPWTYKRTHEMSSNTWYVIIDSNGRGPVVDVGGSDLSGQIAEAKYLVTDPEEIEANARLIASAPDLLEALESALSDLLTVNNIAADQLNYSVGPTVKKIQSAINKAKGL